MRLFIPTIGTRLRLLADWTFFLHFEYRNSKTTACFTGQEYGYWGVPRDGTLPVLNPVPGAFPHGAIQAVRDAHGNVVPVISVTVPAGSVLKVERIYIRSGARGFDSLTFRVDTTHETFKAMRKKRFWAKLADVNRLDVEPLEGA